MRVDEFSTRGFEDNGKEVADANTAKGKAT